MSGPTAPKSEHKHSPSGLAHHATRPHGIIIIGGLIFLAAWLVWTFVLASPIP